MNPYHRLIKPGWIFCLTSLWIGLAVACAFCATVDETEAVKVADLWYAMELNSSSKKISKSARDKKPTSLMKNQVRYLVEDGSLMDTAPVAETVLAYVVTYDPSGFVVVSADDRLLPVVVFDGDTLFRWDEPKQNFLRYFLQKNLKHRWQRMRTMAADPARSSVHSTWRNLRTRLTRPAPMDTVVPEDSAIGTLQWDTANWNQSTYYNTTVIARNGNTPGIPTGCTATAMAIKLRYHAWPPAGNSSHSYTDSRGSVQYSHSVNFGSQNYSWTSMPTDNLSSANPHVADLMYHCGVAVDMNYEVGGSGAWFYPWNINEYFRYKGTTDRRASHETPMMNSILAGLPVILSSSTHTVVADGYRDDPSPYFHINAGWGGSSNGWYNLDQVPGTDKTIDRSYPYSSPDNFIFVEGTFSGEENGNLQNPYNTISKGYAATPENGHLWIRAGSYSSAGDSPMTFTRAMTIHPYRGSVTIGN